jgi:hypothetical protein
MTDPYWVAGLLLVALLARSMPVHAANVERDCYGATVSLYTVLFQVVYTTRTLYVRLSPHPSHFPARSLFAGRSQAPPRQSCHALAGAGVQCQHAISPSHLCLSCSLWPGPQRHPHTARPPGSAPPPTGMWGGGAPPRARQCGSGGARQLHLCRESCKRAGSGVFCHDSLHNG